MANPIINRTPREWVEDCDRCGGTGKRHRRQHFALWTPDEYEHVQPIPDAPAGAYVCTAAPGSSIMEACREAMTIVALVKRPVAFSSNGRTVVARDGDDPDQLAQNWWDRINGVAHG